MLESCRSFDAVLKIHILITLELILITPLMSNLIFIPGEDIKNKVANMNINYSYTYSYFFIIIKSGMHVTNLPANIIWNYYSIRLIYISPSCPNVNICKLVILLDTVSSDTVMFRNPKSYVSTYDVPCLKSHFVSY